jgi:hypothetical protein
MMPLKEVSSRYGAPMGRINRGHNASAERWYLRRVPINNGGYDRGGAYWGIGAPLWNAYTEDGETDVFFRARDRDAAKAHMRSEHDPAARFFR